MAAVEQLLGGTLGKFRDERLDWSERVVRASREGLDPLISGKCFDKCP